MLASTHANRQADPQITAFALACVACLALAGCAVRPPNMPISMSDSTPIKRELSVPIPLPSPRFSSHNQSRTANTSLSSLSPANQEAPRRIRLCESATQDPTDSTMTICRSLTIKRNVIINGYHVTIEGNGLALKARKHDDEGQMNILSGIQESDSDAIEIARDIARQIFRTDRLSLLTPDNPTPYKKI